MATAKPSKCPSCGSQGSLVGPPPYTCLACEYVVTPDEEADNG